MLPCVTTRYALQRKADGRRLSCLPNPCAILCVCCNSPFENHSPNSPNPTQITHSFIDHLRNPITCSVSSPAGEWRKCYPQNSGIGIGDIIADKPWPADEGGYVKKLENQTAETGRPLCPVSTFITQTNRLNTAKSSRLTPLQLLCLVLEAKKLKKKK